MSLKELIVEGARQNNLKNISLTLPHNTVIAVTGVSGSGKSSLAFDTIFAEGQWRFIESLSTYARLFLEKLDRPDVDAIHNIRPAIALEQKNPVRGSRSTVGTLTELYDLFRLLYAKVSTPHCPDCGTEIRKWDPSQVAAELLEHYPEKRAIILFESDKGADELLRQGFGRIWLNGEVRDLQDQPLPDVPIPGRAISVVLDRLVIKKGPRLSDSAEMAWREGGGKIRVVIVGEDTLTLAFSAANACDTCGIDLPEPTPLLFSFNHPVGACAECKGFGNTLQYDEELIIPDQSRSLADGAVDPWNKPACRWWKKQMLQKGKKAGLDTGKPYAEFGPEEKALLFQGGAGFSGINDFFADLEARRYKLHVRVFLSRYRNAFPCPRCQGKRLKPEALPYKIAGYDIAELCRLPISAASRLFASPDLSPMRQEVAKELLRQIVMKLRFLEKVGLDYLTLDRHGKTLSGGEFQRINLSNQLSSQLTGTLYVLDEPTIGLHPRDTERVGKIMNQLAELGNTVLVVEHDREIIESAGWIVELGPGGGYRGGEVVFSGTLDDFPGSGTLTSRYVAKTETVEVPVKRRVPSSRRLSLSGASGNNLRDVDLRVPLQRLTVVTGVSGSGKSSLIVETLYRAIAKRLRMETEPPLPHRILEGTENIGAAKLIDQSPIGRSPRSNPATYLKIFDHIRRLFSGQREAKAYGHGPGFFSFNIPGGRCETCKGEGYELLEMYFFEDLYIKCEKCDGKRYGKEALRVTYKGKNIHDVLNLTVDEAAELFGDHPVISAKLSLLRQTGLGYLRLGQPATTLSGGEAQRLKICSEMGLNTKGNFLYILDEPTVGLHLADIQALLNVLNRLVEAGNTVIVIEHQLDVVRAADWIIDLGPDGGDRGGRIIFEGKPEEITGCAESQTGRYLERYVEEMPD